MVLVQYIKNAPPCLNDKKGRAYGLPNLTAVEGINASFFSYLTDSKFLLFCSGFLLVQLPDNIS